MKKLARVYRVVIFVSWCDPRGGSNAGSLIIERPTINMIKVNEKTSQDDNGVSWGF